MLHYLVRRCLLMIPTIFGITALVFFIMAAAPGSVADSLLDIEGGVDPVTKKAMQAYVQKRYGLDQPPIVQYLRWINKVSPLGFEQDEDGNFGGLAFKQPDLGHSFLRDRPALELIKEALPITLLLNLITLPIIYTVAIGTGLYAARYRGKLLDISTGFVTLAMWSIPTIWAGVMLIGWLANKQYLNLFPTAGLHDVQATTMAFLPRWESSGFERGWLLDTGWHLVLPVLCLSYGGFAFLSKLTRSAILENLSADFVRTARAKGLDEQKVLFRHVFRNSLLPLITVAASILPGLLAGSVIVEKIFSIPGMGSLSIEAAMHRDGEVVLATTLVGGLIGLVSYLIADIGYAIADPRVSYE